MVGLIDKAKEFLTTYSIKQRDEVELKSKLETLMKEISLHEDGVKWLNEKRKELLSSVVKELNDICTLGLQATFGEEYSFEVEISESTRPQCTFYVLKGTEKFEPKFETGGGIVDILAICTRIALWSLKRTSPVIILDEPLKALKPVERQEAAIALLQQLVSGLGLQFIVVTHEDALIETSEALIHKIS
jgi:DNA repair exonuclease SbcCD ATPase subunit